jgi:hypothetical protein
MTDQNISLQDLKGQLEILKNAISKELDPKDSELFDEFIREHEFGLALHLICDHLLESTRQPATATLIQQIQALHVAMKVEDNCVPRLRAKAAF